MVDESRWSDDDLDEREFPDSPDSDDDEAELMPCPKCGVDVYEDAPQCPLCGEYIVRSTSPWSGRPWWWIAVGLAGIMAILYWILAAAGW